ncbi:MAG: hypothetical protein ABW328_01385 [Ilumatobacteraceae bacterium]
MTRWSIELDVREDATRMFVPVELVPDAKMGDIIEVTSAQPEVVRRGQIVEHLADDSRGDFVTVVFE